ncbi:MAG TPA: ArsR family transcriptional regulator [Proteobacteria bacterium]|nr:ArsR family transcriptional regulator [Pseudomonadota bacterium]
MDSKKYLKYSELFKALGHPVRLKIVDGLLSHTCNVGEIVEGLGLPQSTVSQHLGLLRNRGIIAPEKDGVRTCYKVVDAKVRGIIDCINQ